MIPFVQALGIDPARLIPVTRGGAAVWYGAPAGVELYDLRDPRDIRIENTRRHSQTGMLKQTSVTPFDKALLKDAAKAAWLTRYHVLHPAWMYHVLAPFWVGARGQEWAVPHLTRLEGAHRVQLPIRAPVAPPGLPTGYCAARFYARTTFPYSDLTLQCVKACLTQVAATQPVVLLNAGVHADEHFDFPVKDIPNVTKLSDLVTIEPRTNLALQSAVIGGATGFIGTYGGLAQLALRMGKPSVSFYQDWTGTALAHKHLSEMIALQSGVSFLTLRLQDIPLLKTVAPDVVFTASSSRQTPAPLSSAIVELATA